MSYYTENKQAYWRNLMWAANTLGVSPENLHAVLFWETATTLDPTIDNGIGYYGLLQFGGSLANELGYSSAKELVRQNPTYEKQFKLVVKRYKKLFEIYPKINTAGYLYLINFLPAYAKYYNNKSFELPHASSNPSLNFNQDNKLTISDIDNLMDNIKRKQSKETQANLEKPGFSLSLKNIGVGGAVFIAATAFYWFQDE